MDRQRVGGRRRGAAAEGVLAAAATAAAAAAPAATAPAPAVADDDVARALDELAAAATMARVVAFAMRRLAVDEHGGAAGRRLPHVGAAADRVDADVVD